MFEFSYILCLTVVRYPSVLERILGIHQVFAQRQSIRQVSFEFMTRELLWHGFAVSTQFLSEGLLRSEPGVQSIFFFMN